MMFVAACWFLLIRPPCEVDACMSMGTSPWILVTMPVTTALT